MGQGLLIDVTRCVGCGLCRDACMETNGLAEVSGGELSAERFTVVQGVDVPGAGERWVRRLCLHCLDPACAAACPVGALRRRGDGPVLWDAGRCMGCRYCMLACPFGIPRYEWSAAAPRIRKCGLCAPLLARGEPPACAPACPTGATTSGPRDRLLDEARARIRASPGAYRPRVYGEREAGGTGVLFLADVAFAALGLPGGVPDGSAAAPAARFLSRLPAAGLVGGGLLLGLAWVIRRRTARAAAPAAAPASPPDPPEEGRDGGR